jgi:hypothetical protein
MNVLAATIEFITKETVSIGLTALAIKLFVTSVNPISVVAFFALRELGVLITERLLNHMFIFLTANDILMFLIVKIFLDPSFGVISVAKAIGTYCVSKCVLRLIFKKEQSLANRDYVPPLSDGYVAHSIIV